METIPRDATPTWARPKYRPAARDAAPRFDAPPIPLILPDFPPAIPPDVMTGIGDAVLEPLTWHTGSADETLIEYAWNYSDFPYLAVVSGVWPAETEFQWIVDPGETHFYTRTLREALAVFITDYAYGVFSASVMITAPGYDSQMIGPITLVVANNGCC